MNVCDIVFVNVPIIETDLPLQAPAILKATVEKHGFRSHTLDFNILHRKYEKQDPEKYNLLKNYFITGRIEKNKFSIVEQFIQHCCDILFEKFSPKFVGLSIFTHACQRAGEILAKKIKERNASIKIVIGGSGIRGNGINGTVEWPEKLKRTKVIDHFIVAEGEKSIVALLQNETRGGLNNTDWVQITDLNNEVHPDYSDYDLAQYPEKRLMITGSRGCVRKCTFCDIHTHWKKFTYRSGESIFNEMMSQIQKHGVTNFQFTDSLLNGSMKAYRDFVTYLADYNDKADKKVQWQSQFIVRGQKQMTNDDWDKTKRSGAKALSLGIESGSEKIRNDMNKGFSQQDLDEFMEMAFKHKVKVRFLMIVGYPTETDKEFRETLDLFEKYKKYKDVISEVTLGSTLGILPNTHLHDSLNSEYLMNGGENFWLYDKNPSLDFRERIKRRIILGEHIENLGYSNPSHDNEIKFLHFLWETYKEKQSQSLIDFETNDMSLQKLS